MHEIEYKILINEPLTEDIFEMVLDGDTRDITKPGQFINITIPGSSSGGRSVSVTGRMESSPSFTR